MQRTPLSRMTHSTRNAVPRNVRSPPTQVPTSLSSYTLSRSLLSPNHSLLVYSQLARKGNDAFNTHYDSSKSSSLYLKDLLNLQAILSQQVILRRISTRLVTPQSESVRPPKCAVDLFADRTNSTTATARRHSTYNPTTRHVSGHWDDTLAHSPMTTPTPTPT